ncbi:Fer-1-like protein 4 [Camponotus floridanus]|uniref:Fer-1-like protein 4 n=1 Tax=Camponotus floridanus TaxID=104421 RepID=E2B1F0_CAMFO|nr:Fer-1-like protein 4 [Camponotus floridanus]
MADRCGLVSRGVSYPSMFGRKWLRQTAGPGCHPEYVRLMYFVFDFTCSLDTLLSTRITIAVYLRNFLRRRFHGSISFEVATVWEQPDRQYFHKWAVLMNPKNPSAGPKGYVKCNITVNAKGEKVKVHPETEGEDDIEGNLLLPIGSEKLPFRQRARYIFTVYRADGLPDMSSLCRKSDFENINPYVQISFAGMKGSTSEEWQTYSPKFHEGIIFKEMFPVLCHRVRIAIKHRIDSCRTCVVAVHILDMTKISNSGEYGFLPTYGPSFIHFYGSGSVEKDGCSGRCLMAMPLYRGRVLLSLKTEMDDPEASPGIRVETLSAFPIIEKSLWSTDEYLLVGVLYDVCMIDRSRFGSKLISFELSLGNAGNRQFLHSQCSESNNDDQSAEFFENWSPLLTLVFFKLFVKWKISLSKSRESFGRPYLALNVRRKYTHRLCLFSTLAENELLKKRPNFESQSVPRATGSLDGRYNYVPLGSRKPCLYVRSWWPNLEWRMYNSNNLRYIADFLEVRLEKLEALMATQNPTAFEVYNETIRALKAHCKRYLYILDTGKYEKKGGTTKLDRHRASLCLKSVENILERIKINGELPNNNYMRIAMIHGHQYLKKLRKLCEDHSLPDVFIWMIAGSKRVAYSRLSAEQIVHSEVAVEAGAKCGRRFSLFPGNPDDEDNKGIEPSACKIEAFLWLGNAKYAAACWSAIPPGYEIDHGSNVNTFPKYIEYNRSSTFQLRAHIFQGRFDPGMDASGLTDSFVRVTFQGYTTSTRVIRQSLDPFWDQTLIFPPIVLHGTNEYIKSSPPEVVLQVFDQDLCATKEFCGKCIAVPLVKLALETYSPPDFPPKLQWYEFQPRKDCIGSILAAFELIETENKEILDVPLDTPAEDKIYSIPADIRPKMASYRLEVIFWGVRDMRKINCMPVRRPRIIVECAGIHVKSEVMKNAKRFSNFEEPRIIIELEMPELDIYYPSITIKAYDSRGFGCFKYAGICIIPNIHVFLEQLITAEDYDAQIYEPKFMQKFRLAERQAAVVLPLPIDYSPSKEEIKGLIAYKRMAGTDILSKLKRLFVIIKRILKFKFFTRRKKVEIYGDNDDETLSWWSKYFASLQIYSTELEMQPQFEGFQDRLSTFELWRGRRGKTHYRVEDNCTGKFKGHISIYRWPHPDKLPCKTRNGRDAANGLCNDYPPQEPVKLLVRLYVVKGINLQPKDPLSGKSDPYLYVKLGKNSISDRKNYIPNQLNPTFGRMFEIEATFPQDYMLEIQVWDFDAATADDLIGETRIDIENRFYSRHRAHCGIASIYSTTGYNAWRDRERPTQILELLCRRNNLPLPEYGEREVKIGKKSFPFHAVIEREDEINREECMALNVLHSWQDFPICGCALVLEHVERRPLFNAKRPGLEQGKLEMWIDMFRVGQLPPKAAVNIAPPTPEEYEIRVIIWNTEDVPLVESQFLTGEKCSDIYVKGWILYEDYQKTDVHYNSLTGEGNFNWRFVFRVTYSKGENVMIIRRRISVFAKNETEEKLPCKLHLQVWDSDHFSSDDFLGELTLDLPRMPRGSSNSKNCTMKLLEPQSPTINLFKVTRTRAWWPFARTIDSGKYIQAGKVELEISILRAMDANNQPVGKGRDPPQNLPYPSAINLEDGVVGRASPIIGTLQPARFEPPGAISSLVRSTRAEHSTRCWWRETANGGASIGEL